MPHILFVTTTNMTNNPRLVKEMIVACEKGWQVTFLGFKVGNDSDEIDKSYHEQLQAFKINYHYLDATHKHLFQWAMVSILQKLASFLYVYFSENVFINAVASNKRSLQLLFFLFKDDFNPNFIVAHTLPSIFPVSKFAHKKKINWGFDVEDYYPGETINSLDADNEQKRREFLMSQQLPNAFYVSYAAPLIKAKALSLIKRKKNNPLILNSFYRNEFFYTENNKKTIINLCWFSLTIGKGRGLELLIPVLRKYKEKVKLTLIGNVDDVFFTTYVKENLDFINVLPLMPQEELHRFICKSDIGVALELTSTDVNRDIALTNKVLAYYQAGLFILATDTAAQVDFFSDKKDCCFIAEQNEFSLNSGLQFIVNNIDEIRNSKNKRYLDADSLSFDSEKHKLTTLWESAIKTI